MIDSVRTSWVNEKGETVRTCPRCAKVGPRSQRFCGACGANLRPDQDMDTLEMGSVVDKRYRLLAKLGQGGMGAVYRVEHVRMSKIMALKLMNPDLVRDRKTTDRFRREAQLVAKLDHPNIISVFDSGETDAGLLYLVMEYIEGRDLGAMLRETGRFEPKRALEVMVPVLRGLEKAHQAGIIHRDIKPANIMLSHGLGQEPEVKILDFGVATVLEAQREGVSKITGAFDVVGTPTCMSPEQARGVTLDRRSDVYSVAAMIFELIAGRGPFIGGPLEVIGKHLTMAPPTLQSVVPDVDVSPELEAIIAKGLTKDPNDRFQSADELRKAIQAALGRPATQAVTSERVMEIARREDWESFEKGFRRERLWTRLAAAAVLLTSLGVATYLERQEPAPGPVVRVPVSEEQEPNDLPGNANLILLGQPVKGHIGYRKVPTVSDLDVYEVDVRDQTTLSVSVDGVPNVNLVVEILHENGPRTAMWVAADDAPMSTGEEISDITVAPGRYFIRLSDRHRLDEPLGVPRENSTDLYTLSVATETPRKLREREPNNRREDAMAVAIDAPVLGRGGTRGLTTIIREGDSPLPAWSVDHFRLDAPKDHERVCAVLGGLPFAALKLTALPAKDDHRAVRNAPSTIVRDSTAQGLCVPNAGMQLFEVRVAEGSTGNATYPIAFFGSGPDGLSGVLTLIEQLRQDGRAELAQAIVSEVTTLVPRGSAAEAALVAVTSTPPAR